MEWSELSNRLAGVLREATGSAQESILILSKSDEDAVYLQFAIDSGGVVSEISSSRKYLPRHLRLDHEAAKLLKESGWVKPSRYTSPNWTLDMAATADFGQYSALSSRCVTALRKLFAITAPSQLVYDAFTSEEGIPLELNELGLARR